MSSYFSGYFSGYFDGYFGDISTGGISTTWGVDFKLQKARDEHKEAQKLEKIKQDEVIRLKLEAQQLILRKKDIEKIKDKQTQRQLAALQKEYAALQNEIAYQLAALAKLHQITVRKRKYICLLLLSISFPFSSIKI